MMDVTQSFFLTKFPVEKGRESYNDNAIMMATSHNEICKNFENNENDEPLALDQVTVKPDR